MKTGDDPQRGVGGYRFGPPECLSGPLGDAHISTSSDGNVVAVFARTGWEVHRLSDSNQVTRLHWQKDVRGVSVSPDGAWVSLANWNDSGAGVWNAATGQRIVDLPVGRTGKPLFSPDGRWLALTPDGG